MLSLPGVLKLTFILLLIRKFLHILTGFLDCLPLTSSDFSYPSGFKSHPWFLGLDGSCSVQWPLLSSAPLPRVILSEGIQPMKTKKLTKFFKQSLLLIVSLPWLSISRTVHNFDTGCPSLSPALPPFSVLLCLKCVTLVLSPRPLWLLCFLPLFTKTAF